jgi:hypothetical protein
MRIDEAGCLGEKSYSIRPLDSALLFVCLIALIVVQLGRVGDKSFREFEGDSEEYSSLFLASEVFR